MRLFRRIALVKSLASGVPAAVRKNQALVCALVLTVLMALTMPKQALANGLRIGVRIKNELYAPLVPVTQNFKTCISVDEKGVPVVSLCTTDEPASKNVRGPASK